MGKFTIALERFAVDTIQKANTITKKTGLEVFRRIVERTPVREGTARRNWQFSEGQSASGVLEGQDPTGDTVLGEVRQGIARWTPSDGKSVYLSNNLTYIKKLEDGGSQQAPNGMVALTVAEFDGIAEDAGKE